MGGTDITTQGSYADVLAGFANIMATAESATYRFLQFSGKEGRFLYREGDDQKELAPGTRLVIDQNNIKHGYKCWKNNDVVDTFEVEASKELPAIEDMEDHGPYDTDNREGWQTFIAMMLKDDNDNTYRLEISSVSGRKSVADMLRQIGEKAALHSDGNTLKGYAVIEIGATSFKAKNFKNKKPVFTVVDWDEGATFEAQKTQAALPAPDAADEDEGDAPAFAVKKTRKG
jgi:hypothetical protein